MTLEHLEELRKVRSGGADMVTCDRRGGYGPTTETAIFNDAPYNLICHDCYMEVLDGYDFDMRDTK